MQVKLIESLDPQDFESKLQERLESGWDVLEGSYRVVGHLVPSIQRTLDQAKFSTIDLMVFRSCVVVKED